MIHPLTKDDLLRGDIDGTGDLELFDVTCIQRYLCLMKTPYPIGTTVSYNRINITDSGTDRSVSLFICSFPNSESPASMY